MTPEIRISIQKLESYAPINTPIFSTDFILRTFTNVTENKIQQLAELVFSFMEGMEMATNTSLLTEVFCSRLTSFRDQVQ